MRRFAIVLAACGGDPAPPIDSPIAIDTAASTLAETACGSEAATVTANPSDQASMYTPPMTTINQGQVVKFEMPAAHNVTPHPSLPSDPMLRVDFGQTKCFRFTASGTMNFFCTPHGFAGTIVVR